MTGARTSGGACGLIRCNAKNLPRLDMYRSAPAHWVSSQGAGSQVVHGVVSSCRRCWVKSQRACNPLSCVAAHVGGGDSRRLLGSTEEGGDDQIMPLCLGLHACYNGRYRERGLRYREVGANPSFKAGLSRPPDRQASATDQFREAAASSVTIADQQRYGEYCARPCITPSVTASSSHVFV